MRSVMVADYYHWVGKKIKHERVLWKCNSEKMCYFMYWNIRKRWITILLMDKINMFQ